MMANPILPVPVHDKTLPSGAEIISGGSLPQRERGRERGNKTLLKKWPQERMRASIQVQSQKKKRGETARQDTETRVPLAPSQFFTGDKNGLIRY